MKLKFILPLLCTLSSVFAVPVSPDPNDEDFKPLCDIQAETLESQMNHYCSNKFSLDKACFALKESGRSVIVSLGAAALSTACMLTFSGNDPTVRGMAMGSMNTIQTHMAMMMNGYSNGPNDQGGSKLGLRQLFGILRADFRQKKTSMNPQVVKMIETIDRDISGSLHPGGDNDQAVKLIKRRQIILMSLPQTAKNVAHYELGGDAKKLTELESKLDRFIAEVPEHNREDLANLIMRIRDNSVPGTEAVGQVQAYFFGPPGTGKTWFTRSLAKTLGLPLCEIILKDVETADLTGNGGYIGDSSVTEEILFGKLLMCFVNSGVQNPIIFLDEAGDYINKGAMNPLVSILKVIMEPGSHKLPVASGLLDFDISKATFILAGNSPLKNEALKSRVPQLEFDNLERDQKLNALELAIKEDHKHLRPILNEKEFNSVFREIKKYIPFMLDLNEKMGIHGARILQQVVHELPSHIRLQKRIHKTVDRKRVEEFIERSFKMRVPNANEVVEKEEDPEPEIGQKRKPASEAHGRKHKKITRY